VEISQAQPTFARCSVERGTFPGLLLEEGTKLWGILGGAAGGETEEIHALGWFHSFTTAGRVVV
jgi:hypothetical protein